MDELLESLFGPRAEPGYTYAGLVAWYGQAVMDRALELSKGALPEANFMPYIFQALEESRRTSDSADAGTK